MAYVIKYNTTGEIVTVTVSLVLGFVREAALTLEQEFHITFVQVVSQQDSVYISWTAFHRERLLLF